jgi:protein TonB
MLDSVDPLNLLGFKRAGFLVPSDWECEGGVVGGVIGGEIGGVLGGELGGTGIASVYWADVKAKRRVEPRFPEAAKQLNITEETCQVRFFIDERGKPYDIQVEKCSNIFHENVLEAAWKWRFYPYKSENGDAVKSTFVLKLTFKLR